MTIRPYGNRILVKRWPFAAELESGLWLPDLAQEKPQLGDVLAVGKGVRGWCDDLNFIMFGSVPYIAPDINPADVVVFEKLVSLDFQVTVDDEEYLLLPYDRIYAAITGLKRGE